MNAPENTDPTRDLEAFRSEAEALGFTHDHPDVDLESADEFIARMKANDAAATPIRPRRTTARRVVTALVACAAAAVAAVVIIRPASTPVVADTPPVLDYEFAAAVRIAFAPGEPPNPSIDLLSAASAPAAPGSGPIQHHVSDNWFSDQDETGTSVITPRISETWLAADGSLTTVDAVGTQLTADGRGVPTAAPTYSNEPTTDNLPAGTIDANFTASLSTDPETLRNQLLAHSGCETGPEPNSARSLCLYNEIRALFTTYVVEPDLAAAAWQSLRGEEGFTSLGTVEDRAGRNGLAISFVPDQRPQYRFILIGSTETGQLLGTEEILIKADPDLSVKPPAVISFTTITTAERVQNIP